jgi:hypothetical protein
MTWLTEDDKAELLEDANSAQRQQEFSLMKTASRRLTPVEWLVFLTQFSSFTQHNKALSKALIQGNNFKL